MKKPEKSKKVLLVIALIILLLLGIGITVYPEFSARYTESVRAQVLTEYQGVVEDPSQEGAIDAIKQAAVEYNRKLFIGDISPLQPQENGYYEQLNVEGSNIMCLIRIPKIDVKLPVYHGISEEELRRGAGHMPQTSLPIGGVNTHAVISAHTGMASSPMFSDLELLEAGDLVYIDVLGETLTYQVYEIPEPVLPHEVEGIQIRSGKDLLTLVTCTPFGVNTHRLLVHCERVETTEQMEQNEITVQEEQTDVDSVYAHQYQKNLQIGFMLACLIILAAIIYIVARRIYENWRQHHE